MKARISIHIKSIFHRPSHWLFHLAGIVREFTHPKLGAQAELDQDTTSHD